MSETGGRPLGYEELVSAACDGDHEAFEELVRQTYVDTYTLAVRLTGDEEDARDVVQEAYLRAWRSIRRFRGEAQFSTWLYRITANTCSSHLTRKSRIREQRIEEGVVDLVDEHLRSNPEPAAEASALHERVSRALVELPPRLRAVVVLKDIYGLPHEAIAEELDISVAAAKVRLHRGRRRLRDLLFEEDRSSARAV